MSGTVTNIEPQKKHPNRVNVFLDGTFAFGLANFVAAWLHTGQELSDEKIKELLLQEEREAAYQRALHFLSYRPRSVHEVKERLSTAGYEPEVIDNVLNRLAEHKYIGDIQFAQQWIENRAAFRPRSHRALQYELKQKGVQEDVIADALASAPDEESQARLAAEKYERRLQHLEWNVFRNRLAGRLGRLGFSYSVIKPILTETWQKYHSEGLNETMENTED